MTRIAVVIPVGPGEHHARYLDDAMASVAVQTRTVDALVLVDDMHGRGLSERSRDWAQEHRETVVVTYRPPWRLGVGHAFNAGCAVALATETDLGGAHCDIAVMLGSDDMLQPRAIEALERAYDEAQGGEGYYWFNVVYSDGEEQGLPCNAAAFTRGLFRESGGLPIEASSGGMDAAFVSTMLVHHPDLLRRVEGPAARCWVRRHAEQEGAKLNAYWDAMVTIRDVYTRSWQQTNWGRYE